MEMMRLALGLLCLAAAPQDSQKVAVEVQDGDPVVFEFPKEWRVVKVQPQPELPTTLKISAPNAREMNFLITIIADKEGKFRTEDDIRKTFVQSVQGLVAHSVEKRLDLKTLESRSAKGYYGSFTDASLVDVKPIPEGKYPKLTTGMLAIGKTAATFTILTNDAGEAHQKAALAVLGKVAINK
jgi:hypothetical protein